MTANEGSSSGLRDYRKGNWTVQETMILIEAKKMDDERRMKRIIGDNTTTDQLSTGRGKPTELRWKWVEDYCWKNGCFRSQNQCNDKWDNLMRDFKKVRDYERRLEKGKADHHEETHVLISSSSSYWNIEKHERKERNLPSNMLPQIYEALMAVVEKKGGGLRQQIVVPSSSSIGLIPTNPVLPLQLPAPPQPSPPAPAPPLVPPLSAMPVYSQPLPAATIIGSIDSDTSEDSDSPEPATKRRRKGDAAGGVAGESNTDDNSNKNSNIDEAISRSASIIAEAIKACEEREERRHRDLVRLHERRLQIEESKAEINRQGINGLVEAVNKLANSILVLASNKTHHQPSSSSK
ncbi:trihelix transcription factor ASR3-like [Impatiens glandulifera]|uniref:trihelix transcription factor ASR3-like n=1 Tax=Impatiens glandulifera TaxID=253017 RepID=UPI001FB167AA|nr:trihelix transcription factor ASR3-like [Impatiens glandulifera]